MKQLVQTLKEGKIRILEVATPLLGKGMILAKNHYSLISPGTEGSIVGAARKSLIGKAKERPEQAKQVIEAVKTLGPIQAYKLVQKKIGAYSPLGYSSSGKIIDMTQDAIGFAVGDLVACGGAGYANHAEIVAVPKNLCIKLPPGSDLKKAAYVTLGAIALQGVRQAELRIGETCAVIGLGLIGQLTCLLLRAGGVRVLGVYIDQKMVEIARTHCADLAFQREDFALETKISYFTEGIGVDAVIITAATKSPDPINFAGKIARKKGKIVIVGSVATGFDREPYYRKELEIKMSCSYGPGRYDNSYEEKGIDYPVGYIRWTENRNMKAFHELVHSGKLNIDYLTTHIYDLERAGEAYELILQRREPILGILIKYKDVDEKEIAKKVEIGKRSPSQKVCIGFIGAGSYAMNHLLPNLRKNGDAHLKGVLDLSGPVSRRVAEKFGFEFCTSNENDIFDNDEIKTVFIATRHNSHAEYVIKSLHAGKCAYVEKPLCIKESELEQIKETYLSQVEKQSLPFLVVGFNRRFSQLTEILKKHLGSGPMAMIYRINSGYIPSDSWIQDNDTGGGRIIGEVCHFIDYLIFLNGSLPDYVSATSMTDPRNTEDTININLKFKNGSIGTISYFSNGSKSLFKEYIEVYKGGITGIIKDFKKLELYGNGKILKKKVFAQDKGQKKMIRLLINAIKNGKSSPIDFEEIYFGMLTTFKVLESLRQGKGIYIQ